MRINKLLVVFAVIIFITLIATHFLFLNMKYNLVRQWTYQFEHGDNLGAQKTANKIRWIDSKAYAFIESNEAIIDEIAGSPAASNEAIIAIHDFESHDYSNRPKQSQNDVNLNIAYLYALLGEKNNAKSQAEIYCKNYNPPQPTLKKCLNYSINFLSNQLDRQGSLDLYAHAKLNEIVGATELSRLKYFKLLALISIDLGKARHLHDELLRDGKFNDEMREQYCDMAQYHAELSGDVKLCEANGKIPGVYFK